MIVAVIPAAGHSTRMGRPKLALPLGGRTVLERIIDTMRNVQVDHVLVVLGPHVADLGSLAERAGAHALVLAEATPDMKTTIQLGLSWVAEHWRPTANDAWLLVPADHPVLSPTAIQTLLQARTRAPDKSIFLPTHHGKRGHPALITWPHASAIATLPPDSAINRYFRTQAAAIEEVPTDDESVLLDLDTPEDYEKMRVRFGK